MNIESKLDELLDTLLKHLAPFIAEYVVKAVAAEREACAKLADTEAADCTKKRVVPGDLERNYFGGGLRASENIATGIRARSA